MRFKSFERNKDRSSETENTSESEQPERSKKLFEIKISKISNKITQQ